MLTVLVFTFSSVASISVGLKNLYYSQITKIASDAGFNYAYACLEANNGVPQWSDANPLMPNTDCTGTPIQACPSNSLDPGCSVVVNDNTTASFSIKAPTLGSNGKAFTLTSTGVVNIIRKSSGTLWKTISYPAKVDNAYQTAPINSQVQVSAGYNHACMVGLDAVAKCWGLNTNGQLGNGTTTGSAVSEVDTTGVLNGLNIRSISAGGSHTCVIASNNSTYCWGLNANGQLGNNSTTQSTIPVLVSGGYNFTSISAGGNHTCGRLASGAVYCWGYNATGQLGNNSTTQSTVPVLVSGGYNFTSISAGEGHTCGIISSGAMYCWGSNSNGQLGNNSTTQSNIPVLVNGGLSYKAIDAGFAHTCALTTAGAAYCWGYNASGQIGIGSGTPVQSLVPLAVTGGLTFNSISSSGFGGTYSSNKYSHTCAVTTDQIVYCWGYNDKGQLGNNSGNLTSTSPVVASITGPAQSVASGGGFACAVTSDNNIFCWGDNIYGQTGYPSESSTNVFPVISFAINGAPGMTVKDLSIGYNNGCAIATDNNTYCWGFGGMLGDGTNVSSLTPVKVTGGYTFTSVSVGRGYTCALTTTGAAYCWGYYEGGRFGNGVTGSGYNYSPVAVSGGLSFKTIATSGFDTTCGIASDDRAYCWGANATGQLGDGTTTAKYVPTLVSGGYTYKSITVNGYNSNGYMNTCAIALTGNAYCWGYNNNGQLGNGTTTQSTTPVLVSGGITFSTQNTKTISTSGDGSNFNTCAIATNNSAYCWGYNNHGQLGNGTTTQSTTPVLVSGGLSLTTIATGYYTSCSLATNGNAYCWGANSYGQLGNGTTTQSLTPVLVSGLTFKSIVTNGSYSTPYNYTCGITSNDLVYCWGWNGDGRFGNGATQKNMIPVLPPGLTIHPRFYY